MYLIKKYSIAFIVLFLIAVNEGGIYQNNTIKVNDITISKPFGYHFSYMPTDEDTSKYELLKAYFGIRNSFTLNQEQRLFFKFEYIFFNQTVVMTIGKEKNIDLYETEIYKKKPIYLFKMNSCIYNISYDKDASIILMGINKQKSLNFAIRGRDEDTLIALKDDICI